MKLQKFTYQCELGHEFYALEVPAGAYGEFLLRDQAGVHMAYLNALDDPTYKEVDNILAKQPTLTQVVPVKRANILRRIYGAAACDPPPDGGDFQIGRHPQCPVCHSAVMRSWKESEPIEFIDADIPSVTHAVWQSLSAEQRIARVEVLAAK
jgi:hypothetical protein